MFRLTPRFGRKRSGRIITSENRNDLMKIIYIANIRVPSEKGEALQVIKMCSAFAALPHKTNTDIKTGVHGRVSLELVIPRKINTRFKNTDVYDYYRVIKNFKIIALPTIDLMPWQNIFGHLAFRINAWLFSHLATYYIKKNKPDIIYTRDWRLLKPLRSQSSKIVYELHDFQSSDRATYSIKRWCQKIVVISRGLEKKLIDAGIDGKKILVSPDGVDIGEFDLSLSRDHARKRLNMESDAQYVVYTGGLYRWKGIHTLINGFQKIRPFFPQAQLQLVGGTNDDIKEINQYLITHAINNVVVTGHKPYADMPVYLKSADILILSDSNKYAISREYTSPLKLFQYMASSRAIVASGTQAIKEILNDSNAWLFEPDNPKSLADCLRQALTQSQLSQRKALKALNDVQFYTWTKRAENIVSSIHLINAA